jgi:DNA-binding NarL/FixJ family response regulator
VDLLIVFMAHDMSNPNELAALKDTRTTDKGISAMLAGIGAFHDREMCDAEAEIDSALSAARSSADEAAIATLLLIKSRLDYSNQRVTTAIALANDAANLAAAGSNRRLEVDAALAVIDMAGTEHRGARNAAAQRLAEIAADNRHPLAFRRALVTQLRASIEAGEWQNARHLLAQTNTPSFRSSRDANSSTVSLCTAIAASVLNDQDAKDAALQSFQYSPVASERILGRAITALSDRTLEQVERLRELDVIRSEIRNSILDVTQPTDLWNLAWAMSHTLIALLSVAKRREAERDAATLRRIATLAKDAEVGVLCTAFTMLITDGDGATASRFLRRNSYGGIATYLSCLLPKTEVRLTPRQRSCLTLVDRGLTRNEIAAAMGITPGTVGNHLDKAYKKLGLSRIPALTKARRLGLIYAPEVLLDINS